MEEEEVEEGIIIWTGYFLEGLWNFAERGVEFWTRIGSVQAPVCWRFWARGPGYPYDILELGSYLVGRVELGFGQCLHSPAAVNKASEQMEGSIIPR
jgi:hypothetical protein